MIPLLCYNYLFTHDRCHFDAVIRHWPPTNEVRSSNPEPHLGKLVVAYQWSVQNLDQLYVQVLVSFAHKTACHDMPYTVLKETLKPE